MGARICYVSGSVELLCSGADGEGRFEMLDSSVDTVRVVADGFLPRTLPAATAAGPIALEPAPTLWVRLVDASSGQPLREGQVSVVYSTGRSLGPFPVNAAGVRIRRLLRPGEARILARVDGFSQHAPSAVLLEPGKEATVTIELRPEPPVAEPDAP